ncbi:uncharacterized protein LOC142232177 [Haematobia irritans]|uniref:uncharacterized protein LOC142232177 n=1 Tax=Haematobia irritans TaxID=7368 RepID=UPI003F5067A8
MCPLDQLIQVQRETFKTLNKYSDRFEAKKACDMTSGYLQSLAQRIDDLFNIFESQHSEILQRAHDEDIDASVVPYLKEDVYYEFSENYFTFKGKLVDMLSHGNVTSHPLSSTFLAPSGRVDTSMGVEARLPKISLPTFSGNYMEWVPFRDIFVSLVHSNESLSRIQKFYYLKGSLSGEASNLIRTISATDANYETAWSTLESRYHNKRVIVGHLVTRLFNIGKSDGGFQSIKVLLDSTRECIASLENLQVDTLSWDPLLIHLVVQKLDAQTRKDWEQSLRSTTEVPTRAELFDFLECTFRTLESLQDGLPSSNSHRVTKSNKGFSQTKKTSVNVAKFNKANQIRCVYCDKGHPLSKCFRFLALSLAGKNEFVSSRKVCRNCLTVGHDITNCGSPFRCIVCKRQHHTVLHADGQGDSHIPLDVSPSSSGTSRDNGPHVTSHNASAAQSVLLYTIRLLVKSENGFFPLRALLDPGSQGTLITESAVQLLGLRKVRSHCRVIGVGDGHIDMSKFSVNLELFSRMKEPVVSCTALALSNLSSYTPDSSSRYLSLPEIAKGSLADPFFYETDRIDIILGSDVCSKIKIPTESFVFEDLFFQNTFFGWVFSGSCAPVSANRLHIHNTNLETILRSFWEQEEVQTDRDLSSEEVQCESNFESTTKRTDSGRYIVQLPFRSMLQGNGLPAIDNNVFAAFKRLRQLEISFSKRPVFAQTYKEFMREYETLGHMSRIGVYPRDVRTDSYFLPHHGVLKENSTTTKLRVVFDGSSHSSDSVSLNNTLCSGPALQNELPIVMTQWRRHRIAFCADIEKMFRQIDVEVDHRRYQQILWRYSPFDEFSIYELNTVTYGTASAPYLAIRVLHQIARDYESEYPQASKVLLLDSYVDDILSGADSFQNALTLHKDLCSILDKGGFMLRKWITNSDELLQEIPSDIRDPSLVLDFESGNTVKTLGIQWNTKDDNFSFKIGLSEMSSVTKRSILSESASLYDPLGWLTPSTLIAKTLFKNLWENGLDWDTDIPDSIRSQWIKYRSSLPKLSALRIPRWIHWSPGSIVDLHCFCDASTTAYAAVVYSRVESVDGIFVTILQAKSKVSPIKTVTIPRLELCAATLLVKLVEKVKRSLRDMSIGRIFFWSDSSAVLSWIRKSPSTWSVYVSNRGAEIQRFSNPNDWRYVPSVLNPADCASRGVPPEDLVSYEMWWNGPQFLYRDQCSWPSNLPNLVTTEEKRKVLYNRSKKSLPEELQHSLSLVGTKWHFIPPASPNFGGLWEAGVKSTKYHLKRIMSDRMLNFEELTTLLCQIESCLNSRPLAPLSSDPSNYDALTPAHFLIGEPTNCIQEDSLLDSNMNHLTRWKCVEKMKQHFWKRWRNEYLNRLQARPKWLKPKPEAKLGDLVLVADERCAPGQWLLGRIQEIHPGADGHIRVVSVLTKNKLIKRPITKICFLPGNETHESSTLVNSDSCSILE